MKPNEQKDLLMSFLKFMNFPMEVVNESIVDDFIRLEAPMSHRQKVTMAFFDLLPDGLREMAKANFEPYYWEVIPHNLVSALDEAFTWEHSPQQDSFWLALANALKMQCPSVILNGIEYDLTKCYQNNSSDEMDKR